MADMTNEEFKKLAEDIKNNTSKVDIDTVLYNFSQTDNLSGYDAVSLSKLEELLNNNLARTTPMMRDAIKAKIAEQRKVIAQQQAENQATEEKSATPETPTTEEKSATPTAESPTAETPEAATPEAETSTDKESEQYFDAMTSYDLLIMHKRALGNYHALSQQSRAEGPDSPKVAQRAEQLAKLDGMIKDIEKYAEKELSQTALGEHNAPIISDYVEIMTAADPDYKYKDAQKLKSALADYDKANALDGELPNIKDIAKYTQEWGEEAQKLSAQAKDLSPEDKAVFDTLNTMVLTELATEEPDADKEKAAKRYKEKFDEIQAQYTGALNTTLLGIKNDPEQQKAWRQRYLAAHKITAEELKEISRDPARVQALEKDFEAYCTREAKLTLAGVLTTRNAVYASRMSYKTGAAITFAPAAAHKKTMFEKHPEYMQAAKQAGKVIAIKGAATIGFGIVGATAAQGWQLVNTFKKEIKACKEQNGGKLSPKIFAKYLKKNPESIINIARSSLMFTTAAVATVALVASGAATFGLVGGIAGFAATNAAGGVAIKGIKAAVAGGITAVTGGITAYITNKKRKPLKKELMEILQQNIQEDPLATQKKGLFARFQKTPAEKAYSELTAMLNNGDEKMSKTFDKYNLPPEQKERVMQLAKEIKGLNLKSTAIVASTALGSAATAFLMEHNQSTGNTGGGAGNWDPNKSWAENMESNKFVSDFDKNNTVEQIPLKPGEHLPEQTVDATEKPAFRVPYQPGMEPDEMSGELHNLSLSSEDFEKITDGPNTIIALQNMMEHPDDFKNLGIDVEKIQEIGLDFKKLGIDFDEMRGSGSHVKTTTMINHLNNLQLSDADQQKLHEIINSKEFSQVEELLNKRSADGNRLFIQPGGKVTISHQNVNDLVHNHTGHGGNGGNGGIGGNNGAENTSSNTTNLSQVQGVRLTQDPTQASINQQIRPMEAVQGKTESGSWLKRIFSKKHEDSFVMPAGLDTNAQAEQYAGMKAMADYNAKHPDAPITSPEEMRQHGYNIKGTVNGHKIHVKIKNDGNTEIRTVDGVRTRVDNHNGIIVARYNGNKLDPNTVGEGGEQDQMLGKIRNQNGTTREYIRDGDSKYVYERDLDANGKVTSVKASDMSVSKVKSVLRNFGKTNQNER